MKLVICFILWLAVSHSHSFKQKLSENKQWTAKWISAPKNLSSQALRNVSESDNEIIKSHPGLKPALFFRKTFQVEDRPSRATLYWTAKGRVDM